MITIILGQILESVSAGLTLISMTNPKSRSEVVNAGILCSTAIPGLKYYKSLH